MKGLSVNRVYKGLQEEGMFYGHPAVFLNLKPLPVVPEGYDFQIPEQVGLSILMAGLADTNYLVINGNPLLQWDSLIKLYSYLRPSKIEIQTEGTIFDQKKVGVLSGVHSLYYAISPNYGKFSKEWATVNIPNVTVFFKFLVSEEKDVEKVAIFAQHYELRTGDIYLIPNVQDNENLIPTLTTIFKLAVRYNMKASPKLCGLSI